MSVPETDPNFDADNCHNLLTDWSFWYDPKQSGGKSYSSQSKYRQIRDFEKGLCRIGSFSTVEDFWRYYIHLRRPSTLDRNIDFYMFRHQDRPTWEAFPFGGFWILKLAKGSGVIGKAWQDLLFAAIGEQFETKHLVGIMLSIRKDNDYLSIWMDDVNAHLRYRIAEKIKILFKLESTTVLEFKTTEDCRKDMTTFHNTQSFAFAMDTSK